MAKLSSGKTGVIVLLTTSLLIFTACLHLVSSSLGPGGALDVYTDLNPKLAEVSLGEVTYSASSTQTIEEREEVLFDGVRRFVRNYHNSRPDLIFLVLTKDESSWGQESFKPSRTFHDYLNLLNATGVDLSHVSLGIMTSSEAEYNLYKNATAATSIPRVTILFRKKPDDAQDPNWWTSVPRGGRHSHAIQTKRRMHVAALRNELMSRTLHDEEHLIWIDSDIQTLSPGIVQTMISHSQNVEDASIMTARCQAGWNPDYDANSWAGARSKSPSSGKSADSDAIQEGPQLGQKHVVELIKGTTDDEIVHLDSIGGVILYIRASLVHQGLTFPPYYVIGTGWGRDGWDGLETEGMCYAASHLRGGGCYVLGGSHSVVHTNN